MRNRMPVLFVGHGSPQNAVEDNEFSAGWRWAATQIPRPEAVICVSAHWYVPGSYVSQVDRPKTIHDFWGFPEELYRVRYEPPGAPEWATSTAELIQSVPVRTDRSWGLDHGAWTVLRHMYPEADIPTFQLSVNYALPGEAHFAIGGELKSLRDKGVLIIGSGNLVHNLGRLDWFHTDQGFDWAEDFNAGARDVILAKRFDDLVDQNTLGSSATLAVPTPDHYWPLLYSLGAADPSEPVTVFNDRCVYGSVSMISFIFGELE